MHLVGVRSMFGSYWTKKTRWTFWGGWLVCFPLGILWSNFTSLWFIILQDLHSAWLEVLFFNMLLHLLRSYSKLRIMLLAPSCQSGERSRRHAPLAHAKSTCRQSRFHLVPPEFKMAAVNVRGLAGKKVKFQGRNRSEGGQMDNYYNYNTVFIFAKLAI